MDERAHPWIRGDLRVTRAVIDQLDEEARSSYARDEESCGLILGPGADPWLLDEVVPMENRANKLHRLDPETYPRTGRMYFDIDPLKVERAIRAGEIGARPVKVLYHSHLDVGAYFSETDAAAATLGGAEPAHDLAYLVTSIRAGVVDDRKLFIWEPRSRTFVETSLAII